MGAASVEVGGAGGGGAGVILEGPGERQTTWWCPPAISWKGIGERYSSDNADMSVEQRMHYMDLSYILCYKSIHIHTHGVQGMITGGPVGFL